MNSPTLEPPAHLSALFGNRTGIERGIPLSSYLNTPAVSNSMLKEFADCPLCALEYITDRGRREPTHDMILGSAIDCLLCDPDAFNAWFYLRPDVYGDDRKKWNGNATECRKWLLDHRDKPVLSRADVAEVEACVSAIKADPRAAELLRDAVPQLTLFWQDKRTGLQMTGRPDFTLPRAAVDLKFTNRANVNHFARTLTNMGYHRQAAIYTDGLEANGRECNTFYFIAVQGGDRPKVNVRYLKSDALELGRAHYRKMLVELKECIERNEWPGYSGPGTEIHPIDLTNWAYNEHDENIDFDA